MRVIIAVVPNRTAPQVERNLLAARAACTRLASSGGFLEQGSTTLIIGVSQSHVNEVLSLVRAATPGEGVAFVLSAQPVHHGVIAAFPAARGQL